MYRSSTCTSLERMVIKIDWKNEILGLVKECERHGRLGLHAACMGPEGKGDKRGEIFLLSHALSLALLPLVK